jgi:pimeloyl-ACP methyl ester carboxylesterase
MIAMTLVERFKTAAGAERYLAAYDQTLASWPLPHEELDLLGSFGTTHLNVAGSNDLPPLLLLHGFGFSSTQWATNIAALSQHFRVYMPDVIDQMGKSVPTRLVQTRENYATWLIELLDALQIERVPVIGHSYGGWLSLNFALAFPQRVERLVLLSPAASFASLTPQFYIRGMAAALIPIRPLIYSMIQWMTTQPVQRGEAIVEQFVMGLRHFKPPQNGYPTLFGQDELRQLRPPTLLLVGDHEVIYDAKQVVERARQLVPGIQAELVPGGGHAFPMDQPDYSNNRILEFLQAAQAPAARAGDLLSLPV